MYVHEEEHASPPRAVGSGASVHADGAVRLRVGREVIEPTIGVPGTCIWQHEASQQGSESYDSPARRWHGSVRSESRDTDSIDGRRVMVTLCHTGVHGPVQSHQRHASYAALTPSGRKDWFNIDKRKCIVPKHIVCIPQLSVSYFGTMHVRYSYWSDHCMSNRCMIHL